MKRHTNRSTGQSSGHCLRTINRRNGETAEKFPYLKSSEHLREKIEFMDVYETNLPIEEGKNGKPRMEQQVPPKFDYSRINLYSQEVLNEEILFQGRLNKF